MRRKQHGEKKKRAHAEKMDVVAGWQQQMSETSKWWRRSRRCCKGRLRASRIIAEEGTARA